MSSLDGDPELAASGRVAPLRLVVFLTATTLAVLSYPASEAEVLVSNDDSMCVLVAGVLFGAVALSAIVMKERLFSILMAFMAAIVVQAWALHWVESGPFFGLVMKEGSTPLKLWTTIYVLSWFAVITLAVVVWRLKRANVAGSRESSR
jgi:hypothetical protein